MLDLLPPGEYSARAEAAGMSPQVSPTLRVEVGGAVQLTFKRSVAGMKETVTVSERAQMVETNPAAVSALVDDRTQSAWGAYYPAYYQQPTSFMKAVSAYAPRQLQLAARLQF